MNDAEDKQHQGAQEDNQRELVEKRVHRVKLYILNENGTWDDKGIGNASMENINGNSGTNIIVISESENKPILVSQVLFSNNYQRQGDGTIISWSEPQFNTDVAISFQHEDGCQFVWTQLQHYRNALQPSEIEGTLRQPHVAGMIDELSQDNKLYPGVSYQPMGQGSFAVVKIPELEVSNLEEVAKALSTMHLCHRERVASEVQNSTFLKKLIDIFHMLEDLEDISSLQQINSIMKSLIILNDHRLLDTLFSDEVMMDTIGMLEYDESFSAKQNHREVLKSSVVFKEAVPISDRQILSRIHQTFKISYIKDAILPIVLDDATFGSLSSMILINNVEILQALIADESFFPDLFSRLKSVNEETQDWKDLVAFLQELCDLAKHLQPQKKHQMYSTFTDLGLFDVTACILNSGDNSLRLKGMEILMSVLQHLPLALRTHVKNQPDHTLFGILIHILVTDSNSGLQEQMCSVLRMLLDPDSMNQTTDKNDLLDMFYQKYFISILDLLSQNTRASTLVLLLELFSFFLHAHSYWIKYFIMRNKMFDKVVNLLKRKEKVVVLAALRLLRLCVGLKDEFFENLVIKNNLLAPVVDLLQQHKEYNMLNSAILELFEFMRRENLKRLIKYSIETFGEQLKNVNYVQCFEQLEMRHQQNLSGSEASDKEKSKTIMAQQELARMRKRRDGTMEKEEEDYFSSDDADETLDGSGNLVMDHGQVVVQSPFIKNPLVDYDIEDSSSSGTKPSGSKLEGNLASTEPYLVDGISVSRKIQKIEDMQSKGESMLEEQLHLNMPQAAMTIDVKKEGV